MNHIQPKYNSRLNHRRAGMAPMEIVMVLPILCALITLTMYICLFSINRTQVVIEARQETWRERHKIRTASQLKTQGGSIIGRVVRRDGKPPEGGLINKQASRPIVSVANTLGLRRFSVRSDHTLLAGTWDFRTNKFNKVVPLGVSNKVLDVGAASPFGLLGIFNFGSIGSFFSNALGQVAGIAGRVGSLFNRFQLAPLKADISRLRAERAVTIDPERRSELSREISRKERELRRRQSLINQFQSGP